MLNRINELLNNQESFAFETTLSTKSYRNKVIEAKQNGYIITLLFFWLQTIDLAKERVKTRVSEGGHNIEPDVMERRYKKGIENLFNIYLPIIEDILIFDNSNEEPVLIAEKMNDADLNIIDQTRFNKLKQYHDKN